MLARKFLNLNESSFRQDQLIKGEINALEDKIKQLEMQLLIFEQDLAQYKITETYISEKKKVIQDCRGQLKQYKEKAEQKIPKKPKPEASKSSPADGYVPLSDGPRQQDIEMIQMRQSSRYPLQPRHIHALIWFLVFDFSSSSASSCTGF